MHLSTETNNNRKLNVYKTRVHKDYHRSHTPVAYVRKGQLHPCSSGSLSFSIDERGNTKKKILLC